MELSKLSSLELIDLRNSTKEKIENLLAHAQKAERKLNTVEDNAFNELNKTLADIKEESERRSKENKELQRQEEEKRNKQKKSNILEMENNYSIVKEIRNSMLNGSNKFEVRAQTVTVGEGESAKTVVRDDLKPILEPLYGKSLLGELNITTYDSLPQGDIVVPVMGAGNVGWSSEIAKATETSNTFAKVTLTPHRLTAFVDISKQLIAQDTQGVEDAIRRDIVTAIANKLESTIFGADAGDATKPAGIFNGATETTISTFGDICNLEASVEEANVYGEMKYALSPKVKAYFRQLAKSTKNTQLVLEGDNVDGTPYVSSSLVPSKKFAYGDFSAMVLGTWGTMEVVVDPYSQAVNGCIRLVVTIFADAKIAREGAIVFGNIA